MNAAGWVAIAVAMIGFLGVLAKSVFDAINERDRDVRRLEEEERRESARLNVEHTAQWRELRIKVYAELLRSLWHLSDLVLRAYLRIQKGLPVHDDVHARNDELHDLIRLQIGEAGLIGSDDIRRLLVKHEQTYNVLLSEQFDHGNVELTAEGTVRSIEYLAGKIALLTEFRRELNELARKHLGVELSTS